MAEGAEGLNNEVDPDPKRLVGAPPGLDVGGLAPNREVDAEPKSEVVVAGAPENSPGALVEGAPPNTINYCIKKYFL